MTAILFVGQETDIYSIEGLQLDISLTETVKHRYSFWTLLLMNGYFYDPITQGWVQILTEEHVLSGVRV